MSKKMIEVKVSIERLESSIHAFEKMKDSLQDKVLNGSRGTMKQRNIILEEIKDNFDTAIASMLTMIAIVENEK